MKKTDPISVGDILGDYFRNRPLAAGLAEGRAVEVWREVVGDYVAQYTEDVYIRAGVVHVTFSSAAVRSEIYIRRRYIIDRMNEALGGKFVKAIRL